MVTSKRQSYALCSMSVCFKFPAPTTQRLAIDEETDTKNYGMPNRVDRLHVNAIITHRGGTCETACMWIADCGTLSCGCADLHSPPTFVFNVLLADLTQAAAAIVAGGARASSRQDEAL